MDSQHRHELQDNALASWLERQVETIKPQLPLILGVVVALVVGVFGLNLLWSSSETARYASWDGYAIAMEGSRPNLALLERVSEEYGGADAGEWATITLADGQLFAAAQSYFLNRESAMDSLEDAKEKYQQLRGAKNGPIRDRAAFGLARAAEIEGDLEAARGFYEQVSGAFREVAQDRLEALATERVVADYDWLASVETPSAGVSTGPGIPGQLPDFAADMIATPGDGVGSGDTAAGATEAPLPSVEQSIDDILQGLEAEEAAEAEAGAAAADLQPIDMEAEAEDASAEEETEADATGTAGE